MRPAAFLLSAAAVAALLFGLLVSPARGADPYEVAEPKARQAGAFLVIYQGCPACVGFGDVMTCSGTLPGYPDCCAILCKPGADGFLYRFAVIENPSINSVNAAIEAARPQPPPVMYVPQFAPPQQCMT